ncbi:P-loop containing nucleoside triphosphate hydrolase protein [Chaetomium sp. MPI-SDFR-AT-0129]|nr:P-loop containing nucleoside triphosphate hydrolase protein [Chaetomium sp. MPI-SDFR-AT-0129]
MGQKHSIPESQRDVSDSEPEYYATPQTTRPSTPVPMMPVITSDDIVIPIMGLTGVGKSTFISHFSNTAVVGHGLASCTSTISIHAATLDDQTIYLIDTPGFDDTTRSDTAILHEVAKWLKASYDADIQLAGIVYLHRIEDNRVGGAGTTNLRMFRELCGDDGLACVVLATTMWPRDPLMAPPEEEEEEGEQDAGETEGRGEEEGERVEEGGKKSEGAETTEQTTTEASEARLAEAHAKAEERERQLITQPEFWGGLVEQGCQVWRQDNGLASAERILQHIVAQRRRTTLQIQEEVASGVPVRETGAGKVLKEDFERLQRQMKAMTLEMEVLRAELALQRQAAARERAAWETVVQEERKEREDERERRRKEREAEEAALKVITALEDKVRNLQEQVEETDRRQKRTSADFEKMNEKWGSEGRGWCVVM